MEDSFYKRIVCDILVDLAECIQMDDVRRLNERHLHHAFSHRLQHQGLSLGIDNRPATLHPEWPTRKKDTGIWCTTYQKRDRKYVPADPNVTTTKPGFLDFAVGEVYHRPIVGVEFTLKERWNFEEIAYDIMKLIDPTLPFSLGTSLNVIIERNRQQCATLDNKLARAYSEARSRLTAAHGSFDPRDLFFIVVQISSHQREICHVTTQGSVRKGMPSEIDSERLETASETSQAL